MRKIIVLCLTGFAILAGVVFAETGTIDAGSTSVSFTNASSANIVYIYNVAVVSATATNDTYSVCVTKGSNDYQIATVSGTTNSVYANGTVTNPVPVGPQGVYKIVRSVTNYAVNVYIDAR